MAFPTGNRFWVCKLLMALCLPAIGLSPFRASGSAYGAESTGDDVSVYQRDIEPILQTYCFDCHAYGGREGNFAFDEHPSPRALLSDVAHWSRVLKNVRADIMPPADASRPSDAEKSRLFDWITRAVFGLTPDQPDPGRTIIRRLNRLEYRNTVADLMGIDFDTSVEFPPDDSGGGFDNNADALSISPLLAEKYVQAAQKIVDAAVPRSHLEMPVERFDHWTLDGESDIERLDLGDEAEARLTLRAGQAETYRLVIPIEIDSSFDFNPSRATVRVTLDGDPLDSGDYGWGDGDAKELEITRPIAQGEHRLVIEVTPDSTVAGGGDDDTHVRLRLPQVRLEGPLDRQHWRQPKAYRRFFHRDRPPDETAQRVAYAREVLQRFATAAYRRPPPASHVDRLLAVAGFDPSDRPPVEPAVAEDPSFESKVARGMTAVLASPRFLFRIDRPLAAAEQSPDGDDAYPLVDERSLAVRMSYFLWSTMPDRELIELAESGRLREQLDRQVDRMLDDPRRDQFVRSFVGQWLQTRDVESVSIDPLAALGLRGEYERLREYLESTETGRRRPPPADASEQHRQAYQRYREIREWRRGLDQSLRDDMRSETEQYFDYVLSENRPLWELIESDYTFLNERLADHYGIDGVDHESIRRVALPADSPFGGILTQGTFLVVTSNPTRTSPVKRGLFILDNVLGTPAPPAPADVPELEQAESTVEEGEPTLRRLLEIHRAEPLCQSCHVRFDPLGLAFENFTALGTWRDTEAGQQIEPAGQLISGEAFETPAELKRILAGPRRDDFYRCLGERVLSYALGRSLDYRDERTLQSVVDAVEQSGGGARSLIHAVVRSPAFQRMRPIGGPQSEAADRDEGDSGDKTATAAGKS